MYNPHYKKKDQKYYEELILSCIPKQPSNTTSSVLASYTGLKSRDVRFIIQCLRDNGNPICATPSKGYWIAQTSFEMNEPIGMLRSHIENCQTTLDRLLEQQERLKVKEGI